jgi:hypothetical protein
VGSVSSVNPGVADLLQILSNFGSPVLSSPSVASALQAASPSDIVQLSVAATQLEGVNAMFGTPDSFDAGTSSTLASATALLAGSFETAPAAGTQTANAPSTESAADRAANYQAESQAEEAQSLFGTGTANPSVSLFNLFG